MTIEYKDSKRIQALSGETYYQEADGNSGASMSNGGIYYAYGTEIRAGHSSITKKADKWTIRFGRNNSPQGVVEAHIYTGTEGATSKTHSQTSTNSITVDALSTSGADYSFTFATPHTISAGDVFAIVWKTDTSTSGSNYIDIKLFNALTDMPNTRNYMVSTANWDGSDDDGHTWSVAPSPYTTYTLTSKLELIAGKTLITNVQDNSILVEKDTGRRYWSSGYFPSATVTRSDDFSSDGWTDNDSTYIGVSGGSMNWNAKRDGSNDASVYDLTSTSANWVLRFKLTVTNVSSSTQAGNGFYVGLSDSIQTAGQSTSQDFIGVSIYNDNTDTYRTIDADGSALPAIYQGDSYQATTYNTGSIWYYEIIKTGSSYTVEAFSGSDYSTGSEGKITGSSDATGLRYLKVLNDMASIPTSTNPFQGTINDLKFYDGVTNAGSPATWTWSNDSTRGLFAGANSASDNTIDYITIATLSNASDFGDLTQGRTALTGLESDTRGVFGGGYTGSNVATMDYVTIATTGDATSFGSLITARRHFGSVSNNTRGVFGGGYVAGNVSGMEYITIAVPSGGAVQGNDVTARRWAGAVSSETRGVFGGGYSSSNVLSMDYVTISSTGSTTSFGNLTVARGTYDGLSNGTRGMFLGGYGSTVNVIDYITIATTGNATDFGDLTVPRQQVMGASNASRGILAGGADGSASYTSIDYITISTPSNTTNFGDLIISKVEGGAVQG